MVVLGNENSSSLIVGTLPHSWELSAVGANIQVPCGIQELTYRRDSGNLQPCVAPLEVPSMEAFLVGIFVVIIVGAASAFAYVVCLADDRSRTGP